MRDQHRPKQELINEVIALRKQVGDLRDAMTARRRVEDALRSSEAQARGLADESPVGLCMLHSDGAPAAANLSFARMLGYESAAEFLRVSVALGVFASDDAQRAVMTLAEGSEGSATFRRKDGGAQTLGVIGSRRGPAGLAVVAVLDRQPSHM